MPSHIQDGARSCDRISRLNDSHPIVHLSCVKNFTRCGEVDELSNSARVKELRIRTQSTVGSLHLDSD